MTPEEERHLLATVTKTGTKMDALISDDHTEGLVPMLQGKVEKHASRLDYSEGWLKGVIWAVGIVVTIVLGLAGILAAHIHTGK